MYSFNYGYFASTNGPTSGSSVSVIVPSARSSFDSYLQKPHHDMHNEDLGAYCSQEKFSPEFVTSVKQRYASITSGSMEPIFIATNLHNNEHIPPNMATQLLALADTLGHDQIFISIYENGSRDKTKEILHRFNETLNALYIAHRIITDPVPKPEHIHRIEYLAKIRNAAMGPLYSNGEKYG
ncbi:hypothetical protein GGI17_001572 [Coemansia sp. S146]|nr:hypothetical protein GGI17_001572 [Coemansia sp. S146]